MREEMRAGNTVVAKRVNIPLPTCGLRNISLFVFTDSFGLLNLRTSLRIGLSFFFSLCF